MFGDKVSVSKPQCLWLCATQVSWPATQVSWLQLCFVLLKSHDNNYDLGIGVQQPKSIRVLAWNGHLSGTNERTTDNPFAGPCTQTNSFTNEHKQFMIVPT